MRCTPCSSTGSPTTPHVSSSPRRRLGLDISWDVSVEDGWRESSRTMRRAPVHSAGTPPRRSEFARYRKGEWSSCLAVRHPKLGYSPRGSSEGVELVRDTQPTPRG